MNGLLRRISSVLTLSLLALAAGPRAQEIADQSYSIQGVERIVAVADIHGADAAFLRLLRGTGLIDGSRRWSGGSSHLVIVGDVLDRGDGSRAALDLIMALQGEAAAAGGGVHMLLGNHEVMNLTGELGYVTRGEFRAYRDVENGLERRRAERRFGASDAAVGLTRLNLRSAFGRLYPRGFFGHRAAFAPAGRYGQWLLAAPVLLLINDTAFVHGGLPASQAGAGLAAINREAHAALSGYLQAVQTLIDAEVLAPETDFHRHGALASDYLRRHGEDSPAGQAAARLLALRDAALFNPDGPVWYRGMVDCSPALETGRLDAALDALGAERLIIGHTPTPTHQVQSRFDGRLLLADTGMQADYYGGQPAAVIIENGQAEVFYADGARRALPQARPRRVGPRPASLDDDALAQLLRTAEIIDRDAREPGVRQVILDGENPIDVLFAPAAAAGFIPEVAAYRLDRLLGLDLVPVAVRRETGGQVGALYLPAADWGVAAADMEAGQAGSWCPLDDQLQLGHIFDQLLNKKADRARAESRLGDASGKLVLIGNREVFDVSANPPSAGGAAALTIPSALRQSLRALDQGSLEQALGDVLDAARRRALLARRDRLLETAGD